MLTETRNEFVYEAARLAAIAAGAPVVPAPWAEREKIFREQFARVIGRQCGPQRSESPEELHGRKMRKYSGRWNNSRNSGTKRHRRTP